MATDATGTPTAKGIRKYNPDADAPSGVGFNGAMDDIDGLFDKAQYSTDTKGTNKVAVWNGSNWVYSQVTAAMVSDAPGPRQMLASDDSSHPAWIAGGIQVIYDNTASGAIASWDVPSISANFKHLLIEVFARGDTAAVGIGVQGRFNNDSGANYDVQTASAAGATAAASEAYGSSATTLGVIPAASATASVFGGITCDVHNYAGTVGQKSALSRSAHKTGTTAGNLVLYSFANFWRNTAAINRITVLPAAGNFIAGSRLTIYGIG